MQQMPENAGTSASIIEQNTKTDYSATWFLFLLQIRWVVELNFIL